MNKKTKIIVLICSGILVLLLSLYYYFFVHGFNVSTNILSNTNVIIKDNTIYITADTTNSGYAFAGYDTEWIVDELRIKPRYSIPSTFNRSGKLDIIYDAKDLPLHRICLVGLTEDDKIQIWPTIDNYRNLGSASFILTFEEQKIYDLFKINKDDGLLKNLEPISIAKLYIKACLDKDYETEYALYAADNLKREDMGWTLEEHLKIPEQDRGTNDHIYKTLVPLVNGEFVQMDENNGYIKYTITDGVSTATYDMGFQMRRDNNGIWKVSFMPIQ